VRRTWRAFLTAHNAGTFIVVWLAGTLVVLAVGNRTFALEVVSSRPTRLLATWELVPVVCAALGPALLAPRMWSWETLARPRIVLWAKATLGLASIVFPAALPWLAHALVLPGEALWCGMVWNVVLVGSVALATTAVLGPAGGPIAGLGVYVFCVIVQQWSERVGSFVPLASLNTHTQPHAGFPVACAFVAVALWTTSFGRARTAQSRMRNDSG
jgi:hypothetical protein